MAEFVMPKLGADMTSGKLVEWRRQPGERVERGEIIAVIETDKTNVEVEAFAAGVIERLLVEPGDERIPVGTPLALLRTEGEAPAAEIAPPVAAVVGAIRLHVSPVARQRAAALGVDLARVAGSGPGGRVTLPDVEAAAAARPVTSVAPARPEPTRRERMREAIAAAMARSKREIPHYYLSTEVDLTAANEWLAFANRERAVTERLIAGVLFIKAVALALREVPELNGFWIDGRAVAGEGIHIGVAVSLRGGGLVAPAIRNADAKTIDELMASFRDLVQRARANTLKSSEVSDPTITITSLGERGVDAVWGIITPPQLALVGFGRPSERPRAVGGQVLARTAVTATLSGDHRATDGHRGALFLDAVDRLLQHPEKL